MAKLDPLVQVELIKTAKEYIKNINRRTGPYANKSDTELFKKVYKELVDALKDDEGDTPPKQRSY